MLEHTSIQVRDLQYSMSRIIDIPVSWLAIATEVESKTFTSTLVSKGSADIGGLSQLEAGGDHVIYNPSYEAPGRQRESHASWCYGSELSASPRPAWKSDHHDAAHAAEAEAGAHCGRGFRRRKNGRCGSTEVKQKTSFKRPSQVLARGLMMIDFCEQGNSTWLRLRK